MIMGTFDWAQYLALAKELQEREGEEACLRSSISRAYYSVYNLARNRLRERMIPVPSGESGHQKMWGLYTQSENRDCKKIGIEGDRLHARRTKADYHDTVPYLNDSVKFATTRAEELQGLIKDLAKDLPETFS